MLNIRPDTIKRRGKPKVKAGEVSNKQIGDGFGLGKRKRIPSKPVRWF